MPRTALIKQLSLHAIRFAKIIQIRQDIKYNPHKYMSNILGGGVQAFAFQPPDPH